MKKSPLSFIIIFLLMFAIQSTVKAQYILNEADAQYKLFNYKKAVDLYEQAYKKNVTLYIVRRLAQCSALMNNYKETESWCAIAINLPLSIAEDHFNYAKALQNNGEYSHAKTEYHKYAELNKGVTTEQLNFWDHCCDSAMVWMKKPGSYIIKNENRLNSIQSDWGAVTYENSIVFVSDRDDQPKNITNKNHPFLKFDGAIVPDKKHFGWTENKYLRLFTYDKSTDSITLFPIKTGTDYHVGAASFTANGNEMYFSLTRIPEGHMKGKFPNINVEIYSSTKDTAGNWSVPVSFKYNNAKEWSNGDPFITPDGKNLYFASTMPGGKGGIDLYVCHKINANEWDKPHNLFTINTLGNERSPFFDGDNLYFSSDGYVGMGGLDIFKVPYNDDKLGKPQNLGYPANSPQDDFAYNSTSDTTGFLSSNRSESLNSDDIYSFNGFKKNQSLVFALEGKVYNKTHNVIANAMVSLSKNGGTIKIETDDNGAYKFALEEKSNYNLTAGKAGFKNTATAVTSIGLKKSSTIQQDLYLDSIVINKEIRLENIYYDLDKFNIRPDAAIELDKLVTLMNDNPTIWIEIGSHTDSRGKDALNMWLSQQRAEAALQYIISKGINRNRIKAQGYGPTKLLNGCKVGVKCTEAEYQLNRRTEFKIVKF